MFNLELFQSVDELNIQKWIFLKNTRDIYDDGFAVETESGQLVWEYMYTIHIWGLSMEDEKLPSLCIV
jgi:hypothetical protein